MPGCKVAYVDDSLPYVAKESLGRSGDVDKGSDSHQAHPEARQCAECNSKSDELFHVDLLQCLNRLGWYVYKGWAVWKNIVIGILQNNYSFDLVCQMSMGATSS